MSASHWAKGFSKHWRLKVVVTLGLGVEPDEECRVSSTKMY
jgi:hypothetical protein